jgi:hypothetical protein
MKKMKFSFSDLKTDKKRTFKKYNVKNCALRVQNENSILYERKRCTQIHLQTNENKK